MKKLTKLLFVFSLGSSLIACGGGSEGGGGGGGTKPSSHNAGLNCLSSSCHDGSSAAPTFSAAGTIYNSSNGAQTNAVVKFYVAGTNTLITQTETDNSGNFYTTVDMSSHFSGAGVSPEVTGPSGGVSSMAMAASGACSASGCHDSGRKIVAN